jgi:hypothetical protein
MSPITYATGDPQVELGDHVLYRSIFLWWRWKPGRISYVPGRSKRHPEMEHDGLQWVGVSGNDGTFRALVVLPDTQRLQSLIRFLRRTSDDSFLKPDQIPEDQW